MGEQTRGEEGLLADLNEFVRQSSNLQSEVPETSGIRPHPLVESTEQTLDTSRFGFGFGPKPLATIEPESGGGGGEPELWACCQSDEDCSEMTEADCTDAGGTWFEGQTCDDDPCDGACCDDEGGCLDLSEFDCTGTFKGIGTSCDDVPDPCAVTCASFTPTSITFSGITIDCCVSDPGGFGPSFHYHDCSPAINCVTINGTFPLTPGGGLDSEYTGPSYVGEHIEFDDDGCTGVSEFTDADVPWAIEVGCFSGSMDFPDGWAVRAYDGYFYFAAYGISNPTIPFSNECTCNGFDEFGNPCVGNGGTAVLS